MTPIINGAKSWYQFGFFSIQPSEFVKIIYILTMASSSASITNIN
nr:FtsW/RodA/SpoVE family cell cycle protein [Jeotgalicoccus sp. WY2]